MHSESQTSEQQSVSNIQESGAHEPQTIEVKSFDDTLVQKSVTDKSIYSGVSMGESHLKIDESSF